MPTVHFKISPVIFTSTVKLSCRSIHVSLFKSKFPSRAVDRYKFNGQECDLLRCLSQGRLRVARDLLDKTPERGIRNSGVVHWTSLISKFSQNGFFNEAQTLFEIMPQRNLVTYNAMLSAYVQAGRINDACRFFEGMPERNVVSWTSLLCGLSNVGRLDDAKELFDVMPDRNVVSWNSMLMGFIRNGELEEAWKFFDDMPTRNQVSWNAMIAGYAENHRIEEARTLFDAIGERNVITWTSLIAGYCRVGDVEEGYRLFCRMPEKNVVSWTAMIGGFAWNGFYKEALLLFMEMKDVNYVEPNSDTFISLVYACSGLGFPHLGKQLHGHLILNGWDHDDYDGQLSKSLIHMYSEFGLMDFADCIFNKNANNCVARSCNSMLSGYIRTGKLKKARHLFDTVPVRDEISWTSMITGYFCDGNVREACNLFERMPLRDAIAWTAMISGNVQNELFVEAIHLFSEMLLEGIRPLDSTYSTLLGAVGAMAYLDQGRQYHCLLMKTRSRFDTVLQNALISMYAKCGELNDAHCIFSDMTIRDVVSWNSMIMGFSHHGLANKALDLFKAMRGSSTLPNSVTLLAVLSACSHAGLLDHGRELFDSMIKEHSIQPRLEHYICIIDLLGRAGKVEEAEEFVLALPFEPGPSVWGALLGICGLGEKNGAIARRAAQQLIKLDPSNAPAHVLLCNMYAANGQHGEESILREEMSFKGLRKVPGCSWIILKGRVHGFLSGDRSHSQTDEIFSLLAGDVWKSKGWV